MEQTQEHTFRVNLKIADLPFSFRVPTATEEGFYRHAEDMIKDRLAELNDIYGVKMDLQQKLILVALEALVDGQKANDSYMRLQKDVQARLDALDSKIPTLQ
jgi:Cell division protein ZapA